MEAWCRLQPTIDRILPFADECGMSELSLAERNVLLVWSYSAAINDGGHVSFFYNTYGEYAHETVQALHEVGAPEYATILNQAIDLFPARHVPRSVDERNASLDSLPVKAEQVMETLDNEFYALGGDELMDRLLKFWNKCRLTRRRTMSIPDDVKGLTDLFELLGARDPENWAASQVHEGLPQLARYLFLRQAWRNVVSEDDPAWIEAEIAHAQANPDTPYVSAGRALARLRAKGATDEELTDLVRAMQASFLFRLCYLLEDPGDVEEAAADVRWALVQIDAEENILGSIEGLHESVLETDPTGREMRPRRAAG